MVVEAGDKGALSRGMTGVVIRLARRINRVVRRKGCVFPDRYHARAARSPRETRNVLVYVLLNFRKHLPTRASTDPASSAFWFDGWQHPVRDPPPSWREDEPMPVQPPRTWLLRTGWRRHGLIQLCEGPRT